MHRNPKYWDDPEAFVPERFIRGSSEAAKVKPHAWKAFGDGLRGCIGQKYGMEEAIITLVTIYQRFTFELEAGQVRIFFDTLFASFLFWSLLWKPEAHKWT